MTMTVMVMVIVELGRRDGSAMGSVTIARFI